MSVKLTPHCLAVPFHVLKLRVVIHNVTGQVGHGGPAQRTGLHVRVHHRIVLYVVQLYILGTGASILENTAPPLGVGDTGQL